MLALVSVALLAAANASGTLVVLNKAEATASLIDLATGKVVKTLPTGQGPHEAAVSPDGRLALAANYGTREEPGSTLTVIDVAGAAVAKTISLGEYRRPHGVLWLDGSRAAVTCEGSQALVVVDVANGVVEAAVVTGQNVSHMVAVTPDGARAFVANIGSGSATAIDLRGPKLLGQIATGKGAEGIDVTPDGREAWVTNREADSVSVIDTKTLAVVATLQSKAFPIRVKITPDGKLALVSNARSGDVAVFDVASRRELRRVPMKRGSLETAAARGPEQRLQVVPGAAATDPVPIGIVISPDGRTAWVANTSTDTVSVIDVAAGAVTGTLRAGKEPDGMAYSPVVVVR
ncbi:MAG: cytochrome D1 domain-containing protein [Vicinamibacteria bacterium]